MKINTEEETGSTLKFVIAQGITQVGPYQALIGFDKTKRLFSELSADTDRPDVHPQDAYKELLYSLQPGWTLRIWQIFWPDILPRAAFVERTKSWGNHSTEGLGILYDGLVLAAEKTRLPSLRRTFIEFVLPGNEGLAWWESMQGICATYGVQVKYLDAMGIQELAYRIMNPGFDVQDLKMSGGAKERDEYRRSVAPEAFEKGDDYLEFPESVLLPITARGGGGIPGLPDRPWAKISVGNFISDVPAIFSITIHREPPDTMRTNMRARRTLAEGALTALAMKTGRRPSIAENARDTAMDVAESRVSQGSPVFRAALLSALFADRKQLDLAITARRNIESNLRAAGLLPLKMHLIPERALLYLQPGGNLFLENLDQIKLFYDEFQKLLPLPSRRVMPAEDAVWIGIHSRDGRDVHFSYRAGLDPSTPPPPHSLTLILGEMGSGKTTLLRWTMLQRLMQGRVILSIDPEGENNALCQAMGGRVIPACVPDEPETCLLHPLQAESASEMLLATRFLLATLIGEEGLTPGIQAVLHEAVQRRWVRNPGNMSIADLVDSLGTLNDPNAAAPMALLRPYMHGGLWEGFFDRPKALLGTEIEPGQWLNFDLSTLREENKGIIHSVLAWFLYNVVTVGKTAMDIYIDEGWRLLRSGPFADLLDELGRRARKRDIGVTLITHMPQDLVKNPTSLSMASTAFIGRIGPDEAFAFFRSMGVPEGEARRSAEQVSRLPPHTFMAAPSGGRGALFPVYVLIPQEWLEFWKQLGAIK